MQTVIRPKFLTSEGTPATKSTVVIDFGNGQVKALVRPYGASKFERVAFPSYVAPTEQSNSDCLRIVQGQSLCSFLIGDRAADIPLSHTGRDESGKATNAKLLLLHVLRLAFGTDASIHCDVVFTSPSNKTYGAEISAQLEGIHPVTIPADTYVIGSEAKTFTVVVHRAAPQLEGHYAFSQLKIKDAAWIIDCGNRTVIATKVAVSGRILKRAYFGGVGVRGMAERITTRESLASAFKEHSPEKIIDYLLSSPPDTVANEIAPDVRTCVAEAIAFIGTDDSPRHLIGGGAAVPGLAELLNAKVAKDAQWINIKALAAVSDKILGA